MKDGTGASKASFVDKVRGAQPQQLNVADLPVPEMKVHRTSTASIWVKFPKLGQQYWDYEILMSIARGLGNPVGVDKHTLNQDFGFFELVLVEINLAKSIPGKILVEEGEGKSFFQEVEVDKLPKFLPSLQGVSGTKDDHGIFIEASATEPGDIFQDSTSKLEEITQHTGDIEVGETVDSVSSPTQTPGTLGPVENARTSIVAVNTGDQLIVSESLKDQVGGTLHEGWFTAIPKPHNIPFRFKKHWIKHESLKEVVKQSWEECLEDVPIRKVMKKLKRLKEALKIWSWETFGDFKEKKKSVTDDLERIMKEQEEDPFNVQLQEMELNKEEELNGILDTEAAQW
ncbi:hypothetical protein IFM89_033833 [Coptis chinensis]|uniref:DUF4283 domain-containing protein n=1 Tax=Coptis chinensis TaxID=261450 RepID=A0A835HRW1_9MAGN|nr:hypothetical protein IFM89_033833 [Coptis chinensis]